LWVLRWRWRSEVYSEDPVLLALAGSFAGIALTGATLRQDLDENAEMYGTPITAYQRDVIERLEALPGVLAASLARVPPLPRWSRLAALAPAYSLRRRFRT
jgi:hypothetical protein